MKYSVVIPARNAEKYLSSALESVRSQRLLPEAVVVVDDGSSDATARIAASYDAIVISLPTSQGQSAARNAGVAATSTELVAFLDADDEWTPDHAVRTVAAFANRDVVFTAARASHIGSASGEVPSLDIGADPLDLRDILMLENPIVQSGVVIRRDVLEAAGLYDEAMRFAEDYDLWCRVADEGLFCPVVTASVRRRIHEEQLTSLYTPKMLAGGWEVRRRTAARRLPTLNQVERDDMIRLLCEGARRDIDWAVWTGESKYLSFVRSLLEKADTDLQLRGVLASIGGSSLVVTRISQDIQCRMYDIGSRMRIRRGPSDL